MENKTIVITGATSGIGRATALKLATFGSKIVLIVRDTAKAEELIKESKVKYPNAKFEIIKADLEDLSSIKDAAKELLLTNPKIDILINNAGGIFSKYELTKDGFEKSLQINHLSPFLLTNLLLPHIKDRIINVSSDLHKNGKINMQDIGAEVKYNGWSQYSNTKLMNVLFTRSLAAKFPELLSVCLHPGVVKTSFGANNDGFLRFFNKLPFLITPEDGAKTSVYLASQEKEKLVNGGYYKKSTLTAAANKSRDVELAEALWMESQKLCGL